MTQATSWPVNRTAPPTGRCGEAAPQSRYDGFADLYACCPAAATQPHTPDCALSTVGGDPS